METIKSPREIDVLFKQGRRASSGAIGLIVKRTPEARGQNGRVLFIAGKRLGGAVERNRCKRVMREAVRRCGGPWSAWDVALVARPSTGHVSADELDRGLVESLRRAGVVSE
ncbi:MAG TPA: ribonuclease P protein component [Coriobacteriia bacterium]|nr:MAG: Ribonuclease P protein component [Actinobacteria bacterium 66_15]HAL29659.1 ribonuclease P protein component [Coriobacteriia bacterium]